MPDDTATATTTTTTTGTEGTTAQAPPATSTTGFDWKAVGVDDGGLNLINERQWKGPGDLLKSYTNLEKLTGVPADRLIKIPKDNDPKAWGEVYSKLGRPESADKYTIPVPEGQPKDFATKAGEWFFEAGLPQAAVTKISEKWNGFVAEQTKAQAEKTAQEHQIQINKLKEAWGPDYDKHAEVVDRAAETFGMNQDQLSALKQVMGPKSAMEFLHKIGSKIATESSATPPGMGDKSSFQMTPEMAQAKIAELRSDRNFAALFNSKDPKQRMDAQAEMTRLHQLAYPGMTELGGQPSPGR